MNVVYIPLDERPCNYSFAKRLTEGSEINLTVPCRNALGNKKTSADFELIKKFMLENAKEADSYIVSIDMLLYGGIVPSRLHHLSEEELAERLDVLDRIREINPKVKIYAFALIMRCPKYSSSDEEPDYYEHCGREIFLTGQVKHKLQLGLISDGEAQTLLEQYGAVTGCYLADFEARRAVNRNMLVKAVNKLKTTVDYLIIPQDDSAEYGYTSMDREQIKLELKSNGLEDIPMYPGADEVGMTLLARAVCEYKGVAPKIFCEFPHENAQSIIPLYEDRPLYKTLPFQIECAGCIRELDYSASDIALYLNYPSREPVEVWQEKSVGYGERDLEGFSSRIVRSIELGKVTAIADGAYCNGGDREFLQMLGQRIDLLKLSAYAGWNTSSNTLGTVICQAVLVLLIGDNRFQKRFLAERIFEDVGYCGYVRAHVTDSILPSLGYNYFDAGSENGEVSMIVKSELEKYIRDNFFDIYKKYEISVCRMPWRRMFEVDLELAEKQK